MATATARSVYLHPGQLVASTEPCTVTTILGSCVAVCLWDGEAGVGGVNHFLLPHQAGRSAPSPRFGAVAMPQLLERLVALGARPEALRAKLFGGASVLEALRGTVHPLGEQNVDIARRFLREARLPVMAEDVRGVYGRKLTFETHDGSATVRLLTGGGDGAL